MPLSALDFYAITYSVQPPLLRGQSLRALSGEEMTEACEVLLDAAERLRCPFWLLDGRANPLGQPLPLRQWLREEYFPRARVALGQPLGVAYLVTPAFRRELDQRGFGTAEALGPGIGHIGWFVQEEEAVAWLAQHPSGAGDAC